MTPAAATVAKFPLMDEAGTTTTPGPPQQGEASPADATVDLVQRARSGDSRAVQVLFGRYETRLRRWAHGRLPAQSRGALDTQDLVQDTLVRVFQRLPHFEPRHGGAFRDYVWTTLWNCVRDLARKHQRSGPIDGAEMDELPTIEPSPLEQAIGGELLARYEAAMERLEPEEREAIVMRIELGLCHAEVAQALGKPSAAAAHMFVSRAMVRLAKEMAHGQHAHP